MSRRKTSKTKRSTAAHTQAVRVVHAIPGRVRLRFAALDARDARTIEAGLRELSGVRLVRATASTASVVVEYDPAVLTHELVVGELTAAAPLAPPVAVAQPALPARTGTVRQSLRLAERGGAAPARALRALPSRRHVGTRAVASVLPALPAVRRPLARLIGENLALFLTLLPSLLGLAEALLAASSPLGVALAGVQVLKFVSEVGALRAA